MKAVQINSYGGTEVLEISKNLPEPSFSSKQILVEVRAACINPFDITMRSGILKEKIPLQFPITLGGDFAGVVKEVGSEIKDFLAGDEVYGQALVFKGNTGSFSEFVAVSAETVAKIPKSVSFREAGALPLVGTSALQAIKEHINLHKGQKILIHGGAGGIGHLAIQLAKAIGSYVATTVSSDDMNFVKELGADEVIDYKTQAFERILKDYDAVYDTVGGETANKSFTILKKGGILVSMLGQPDEALSKKYGIIAIGQGTKITTERLKRLTEYVDGGKIKVNVDKEFPLEKVVEAFDYFENSSPRGKVVLTMK